MFRCHFCHFKFQIFCLLWAFVYQCKLKDRFGPILFCVHSQTPNKLGQVVQSWISTKHGLKFNLLFWFGYICPSVYFKTLENKTSIYPDMNCGKLSSCF
jgi:hypothetical protein